eukprot:Skav200376  [mRNA]  locus=scaffold2518:346003:353086:- [translate_table: standard]
MASQVPNLHEHLVQLCGNLVTCDNWKGFGDSSGAEVNRYMRLKPQRCQVGWGNNFEDAPKTMDDLRHRLEGAKVATLVLVDGDTSSAGQVNMDEVYAGEYDGLTEEDRDCRGWERAMGSRRRTVPQHMIVRITFDGLGDAPAPWEAEDSWLPGKDGPGIQAGPWLGNVAIPSLGAVELDLLDPAHPKVEKRFPLGPMEMADDGQANL